jgi:hypothetical protein
MSHNIVYSALVAFAVACMPLHAKAAPPEPDTDQTRITAAERYAKAANMQKMMNEAIAQTALQVPEKDRADFIATMKQSIRMDVVESGTILLLVKHFTTDELNAMADFYGSATGQSILSKFGPYIGDALILIQDEMRHALQTQQLKNKELKG